MDGRQREIFTRFVLELKSLSKCRDPKAAAVFGGEELIGSVLYSYSKPISEGYDSLPVQDIALRTGCCPTGFRFDNLFILSSYFPSFEEFRLLSRTSIRQVYYLGEIEDEQAVAFLNTLTKECKIPGSACGCEDSFTITKIALKNSQI